MSRVRRQGGSAHERRSWRQASVGRPAARSSRSLRWLFTIVVLALIAAFALLVIPILRRDRHLVAIAIWATDQLAVPPAPYAQQDLGSLSQLSDVRFLGSLGLQDQASFSSLGNQLGEIIGRRDDLLVLYLIAHGFARGDQAHIVCSDFMRAQEGGSFPVADLLRQLAACPGRMKLLVLDSGRMAYDPRLGIAANEFPRLVERQLAAMDEQELWVLLPSAPLERPAVAHPWRQTLFGHSLADALHGAADRDPVDRYITLFELYHHIQIQSARWGAADSSAAQTPLLLKAGQGAVTPTREAQGGESHRLVWVEPAKLEEPAGEGESETLDGPAASDDDAERQLKSPPTNDPDTPSKAAPTTRRTSTRGAAEDSAEQTRAASTQSVLADTQAAPPAAGSAASDAPANTATASSPATGAEPPAETSPNAAVAAPSPAGASPAAEAPPPIAPPATAPVENPAQTSQPADGARGEALVADGPSTAAVAPRLRQLNEIWSLRDELQTAAGDPLASPIQAAPHLWRELNARLLVYEQRVQQSADLEPSSEAAATDGDRRDKLGEELDALLADLRTLRDRWHAAGSAPGNGGFRNEVVRRLDEVRQNSPPSVSESLESAAYPEVARIRAAAFGWNSLAYEARDLVRWYDAASLSSSRPLPEYETLRQYLANLALFANTLAGFQSRTFDSEELEVLAEAARGFDALIASRDSLDRQLQLRLDAALADLDQPRHQQQVEDMLATARLPAERRGALLKRLSEASVVLPPDRWDATPTGAPSALPAQRTARLLERLELEAGLIGLADVEQAAELRLRVAELAQTLSVAQVDEDAFWDRCRRIGGELRDFYAALPMRGEHAALYLIDPRDAKAVPLPPPAFRFELSVRIRPQLRLSSLPDPPRLELQPKPVSIELSANQRELLDRIPQLQFDDRLLAVTAGPDSGDVQTGDGWFSKLLTWQVAARLNQDQAGVAEASLTATVSSPGGGAAEGACVVQLTLPQPNRLDLEVIRLGSTRVRPDEEATIPLDLYPNRMTAYQFALVNRSGIDREVEASLYAIPARWSHAAPGAIDASVRQNVLDPLTGIVDAVLIAKTPGPLPLPADESRVPLTFADMSPAPAEKPAAAPESKPAPSPPGFSPVDVSRGLLCVITDRAPGGDRWAKWIEWKIAVPRRFLEAEIGYDYRRRGIVARISGKDFDGDGQLDLPRGEPAAIRWLDDQREIPEAATKRLTAKLDPTAGSVELFAGLEPDDRTRTVNISVDGYPRGLVYEVPCLRDEPPNRLRPGSDVRRTDRRVRINRIAAPGFAYEFHFPPYVHWPPQPPPPAAEGAAAPPKPVAIERGQYAVIPAPCPALQVDFEVDAPVDAFRDAEHRVELVLGDSPPAMSLRDDRQAVAQLVNCGERGLLEFATQVGDYSVQILPGSLENVRTFLEARLLLPGIGDTEDHVLIALDSERPVIADLQLLSAARREAFPQTRSIRQVPKGTPLVARLQVNDLSGIRHVEYEFADPAGNPRTLQTPKRHVPELQRQVEGRHIFDVPLDTKELAESRYRLLLRVRDLADQDSQVQAVELAFATAAPASRKGVIAGVIRFGSNASPVRGDFFRATLEGPDRRSVAVQVAADGSFSVPNLPPGEYKLTAKGSFLNRLCEGTLEGVQPVPPGDRRQVILVVDRLQ